MAMPSGAATFPLALWALATVVQVVFLAVIVTIVVDLTLQLLRRNRA
jgi:hypothetical protein